MLLSGLRPRRKVALRSMAGLQTCVLSKVFAHIYQLLVGMCHVHFSLPHILPTMRISTSRAQPSGNSMTRHASAEGGCVRVHLMH